MKVFFQLQELIDTLVRAVETSSIIKDLAI